MYSEGDGIKQDKYMVFEWYKKSENQGNTEIQIGYRSKF